MKRVSVLSIFLFLLMSLITPFRVSADRATSSNFIVESAVIDAGGDDADSANFNLPGVLSQPAIGVSTSSNFRILGGFLAFPSATDPVLSAAAGTEQVVLDWTASEGFLGFNISGYDLGTGTASGNETFENVGSVLTFTKTGLTGGQTYYFIVRAKDEFGEIIAVSNEVSATPSAAAPPPSGPGPGGGGGHGGPRLPFYFPISVLLPGIIPPIIPIPPEEIVPCSPATDLNCDGRINLSDLSIFLYFLPQEGPSPADFNRDSKVDLKDLSVLFSDWTGRFLSFIPERARAQPETVLEEPETQLALISEAVEPGAPPAEEKPPATEGIKFLISGIGRWFYGIIVKFFNFIAGFWR